MAQTFLQIKNRILSMESNLGADDSALTTQLNADVNEVYRELNLSHELYWNVVSATVAAAGSATYLTMPSAVNDVLYILDPNSDFLEARDLSRHITHASEIESKCSNGTYAMRGVNATTGYYELALVPAATAGNYTVWYTTTPTDLSADGDYPKGPPNMADWLVWRTRYVRLLADEERPNLIAQSEKRSEQILQNILKHNVKVLARLFRGFPAR